MNVEVGDKRLGGVSDPSLLSRAPSLVLLFICGFALGLALAAANWGDVGLFAAVTAAVAWSECTGSL